MKLLKNIKQGQPLSRIEQEKLLSYLGFKFSLLRFIFSLIIVLASIFLIYVGLGRNFFIKEKCFYLVMLGAVLLAFGLFNFFNHHKTERILDYFDSLSDFTDAKFKEYARYQISYVKNIKCPNNPFETNKVYLLTDGFNIIIFEDFLVNSEYLLPKTFKTNIRTTLPIYDFEHIDSKPVLFTVNDIMSYKLIGREEEEFIWERSKALNKKTNDRIEERILLLDQFVQKENYVGIIMANGSIIRLDIDAIETLREVVPNKEVK